MSESRSDFSSTALANLYAFFLVKHPANNGMNKAIARRNIILKIGIEICSLNKK
jgi:hypothetical protein